MIPPSAVPGRLLSLTKAAGGVAAWCRAKGLSNLRGNVENMAKAKVKVSPTVAEAMGLRRVVLEVYLEEGESLPENLAAFEIARKPIPGRPKKAA